MTNRPEIFAECDRLIAALDRRMELDAAVAAATTETDKYWAGSAWASVARDYKTGRTVTVKAGR